MNNPPNNQQPKKPLTRAEYEAMRAKRHKTQKRKQRQKLTKTALAAVLCLFVFAAILFSVFKIKDHFTYKDPADIFGNEQINTPADHTSGSDETQQGNNSALNHSTNSSENGKPDPSSANLNNNNSPTESRISFLAAGDNLVHSAVFEDAAKRSASGGYNFIDMYAGIADLISRADLAYVNQETPMAGASYGYSGYPSFNTPQAAGDALVSLGFDTVNIATNHMLDQKTAGLSDSIAYWKTKDVTLLGAYTKSDYDTIRTQTVNGITIAWLSYTYGTNGYTLDAGSDLVIPYIDETDIRRQAELAKQAGDIVIASMHWGTDSAIPVDSSQKSVAKLLADCGVDVIIGTHSHTLQGVEWLTSTDGTHKTLCYYSLGNLISTMLNDYLMVGGLATFDIVKDNDGVRIEKAQIIPTMCHYSMNRDGLAIYTLENYNDELANAHGAQKNGAFTYNDLLRLVKNAVSTEFLPAFYQK